MKERIIKRYSVAFRRHVVSEYEEGTSITALQKRYGITGNHTIQKWISQYGQKGLRHKLMHIQHPDEQDRLKELEARVQELESALAQVTLDKLMYEAMVDVAEQHYGLELKKTRAAKSSNGRKS